MKWIDTHTHTYDTSMGQDPDHMVVQALEQGVYKQILGGVDLDTVGPIKSLCLRYPDSVYATIGLHPTEVRENYSAVLDKLHVLLSVQASSSSREKDSAVPSGTVPYVAIGEIGMDLYWDKTYRAQQEEALRIQLHWAKEFRLPVVLHVRDAFEEVWHILKAEQDGSLQGVFHCFSGNPAQARRVADLGFRMGIGGVLTFKNSRLYETVQALPPEYFVLETDAPYLSPVPFRGKPNESSRIPIIGQRIAELWNVPVQEAAEITTRNALSLFPSIG